MSGLQKEEGSGALSPGGDHGATPWWGGLLPTQQVTWTEICKKKILAETTGRLPGINSSRGQA